VKEEVESKEGKEEEEAWGDGGGGQGSEGRGDRSGSCSTSTNQHFASIKEEKDDGLLPGMDPILYSAWAGDDVPVFDEGQLDLMFFQGTQR